MAAAVLLAACGGDTPPKDTLSTDDGQGDSVQETRMRKTKNIFYNIPSPMETAALLKKAGAEYNGRILNDVKNVDRYTAASKQALNLGVYGADLSYASVFNQTQESMFYTSCAKKLADRLGVSGAFDDGTMERMEKNMQNRDSLLNIISETYWDVDGYLKENDREHISALMIAGGWVEGLYIATQVAAGSKSPELYQRVAEQKLSLGDLMGLLGTYEGEDPALDAVREDLKSLESLYAGVDLATGGSSVTEENGVTVIGGDAPMATLTDEQLTSISEKAAAIRNNYIN